MTLPKTPVLITFAAVPMQTNSLGAQSGPDLGAAQGRHRGGTSTDADFS